MRQAHRGVDGFGAIKPVAEEAFDFVECLVVEGFIDFVTPLGELAAGPGPIDDELIEAENLRSAKVIFSEDEASYMDIDHDDSHAARPSLKNQDFALLIHGTQPKGSTAAEALKALKGKGSYSRKGKVAAV